MFDPVPLPSLSKIASRNSQPGPEASLVRDVLDSGLPGSIGKAALVYREVRLPHGFPDLVAVYLSNTPLSFPPMRQALEERHLRLLHHLSAQKRTSFNELRAHLSWKAAPLEQCLVELAEADLILLKGQKIVTKALSTIFAVKKIVAIEAKMKDWKRALEQASANTWFASHSFILLPFKRITTQVSEAAESIGIGVMGFDGTKTTIHTAPRVCSIPSSYGSWLFNEWTVRRVLAEG